MPYTNPYDAATPTDAGQDADELATRIRTEKLMFVERFLALFGLDFTADPMFVSKIVSLAAGFAIRNAADSADILKAVQDIGVDVTGQGRSIEVDAGNSGAADTINWNLGNNQKSTLTGNVTYTLSNPRAGASYLLRLVQDGTGGRTITWPATVRWPGGSAPTFVTTAARVSLVGLYWTGAVYLATLIGTNYDVS